MGSELSYYYVNSTGMRAYRTLSETILAARGMPKKDAAEAQYKKTASTTHAQPTPYILGLLRIVTRSLTKRLWSRITALSPGITNAM